MKNMKLVCLDESRDITSCITLDSLFSSEEIDKILNYFKQEKTIDGTISSNVNNDYRKSKVIWLKQEKEEFRWIYEKLLLAVGHINKEVWGFDLSFVNDSIQLSEYHEGKGHYDYHLDIGRGSLSGRKLSIVVQLSFPYEYVGGELEILSSRKEQVIKKERGTVVIFPSFLLHRVLPVTRGVRKSLVMWVGGSSFR